MTRTTTTRSILSALALCLAASIVGPAAAQEREWLNPDVIALRDEVEALSREIDRLRSGVSIDGGAPAAGGGGAVSGDVFARLGQIETELRRLRGDLERVEFAQRRAIQNRDAQIAALEFRLATLEELNGIEPAAPSAPSLDPAPSDIGGGAAGGALGGGALGGGVLGTLDGVGEDFGPLTDAPRFEGGAGGGGGDAGLYQSALQNLRSGAFEDAEREFQAFIDGAPGDPRVGEAVFWLGETHYVRGEYQEAARAFLSGFRDHRDGPKAADSLLKLGMSLAQLNQRAEACQTFAQVPVLYPDAASSVLRRATVEAQRAGCS